MRRARAGVDYFYAAYTPGRHPVGWNPRTPVELRPVGDLEPALYDDLVSMADELSRSITLSLSVAEPLSADFMPDWPDGAASVPIHTIAVAALDLHGLGRITGMHPGALQGQCSGQAMTATDPSGTYYERAYVGVLNSGLVAHQTRRLRHQIGHALGLAHCRSTERLMHLTPKAHVKSLTSVELDALQALHTLDQGDSAPAPMCMPGWL